MKVSVTPRQLLVAITLVAVGMPWPSAEVGPIVGAKGETWTAIDLALKAGARGLRELAPVLTDASSWMSLPKRLDQAPLGTRKPLIPTTGG